MPEDRTESNVRSLVAPQGLEGFPLQVTALHADILQQVVGIAEQTVQFAALLEALDECAAIAIG